VVGATTALRVGAGCVLLLQRRSGPLVSLAVRASFGPAGPETQAAEATLRDELVALARESAELSWRELRRGVNALDSYTRPSDQPLHGPRDGPGHDPRDGPRDGPRPRPYRVKS
jgi:hypothetical protein